MKLNNLKPKEGSKRKARRLGRGIGSGLGKTSGKGHKGQKARAGGYHKVGFEGGQMPMQRRVPKFGFTSRKAKFVAEIRLDQLQKLKADVISLQTLIEEDILPASMQRAKVILAGSLTRAVTLQGLGVTKGAREAIEAAGGKIE